MIRPDHSSQNSIQATKNIFMVLMLLFPALTSATEGTRDNCSKLKPGYFNQLLNSFKGYDDSLSDYRACILSRLSRTSRTADDYYHESQQTDPSYREALGANMVKYESDPEMKTIDLKSLKMQSYQVVGGSNASRPKSSGTLSMGEPYKTARGFESIGSQTK